MPEIRYCPGKDNPADYLSRHPIHTSSEIASNEETIAVEYISFIFDQVVSKVMSLEERALATTNVVKDLIMSGK